LAARVQTSLETYTNSLTVLKGSQPGLPMSTHPGMNSGFHYLTALGKYSLASLAQFDISVVSGKNMFNLTQAGDRLPVIQRPAESLSEAELRQPQVLPGVKARDEYKTLIRQLILRDRLQTQLAAGQTLSAEDQAAYAKIKGLPYRLEYYDPANNQEAVIVETTGKQRSLHIVLLAPVEEIVDYLKLIESNLKDARERAKILRGDIDGGAVISRLDAAGRQGAPVTNRDGGVIHGKDMFDRIMAKIRVLPTVEQRRIEFVQNYANFRITLDIDGDGKEETVVATLFFPLDKDVISNWENPSSGRTETHIYRNALLRYSVTDDRIVVSSYDEKRKIETGTTVYVNPYGSRAVFMEKHPDEASRAAYVRALTPVERTVTQRFHISDRDALIQPNTPVITKLRVDYLKGETSLDTYGLYRQPIRSVNEQFITVSTYNSFGLFQSSKIVENRQTGSLLNRLTQPVEGAARFTLRSQVTDNMKDLAAYGYKTVVVKHDVQKDLARTIIFDNGNLGRVQQETYEDTFEVNGKRQRFTVRATPLYSSELYGGAIPYATLIYSEDTGELLKTVITTKYDAAARTMHGQETDHTRGGKVTEYVWDPRYVNPVKARSTDANNVTWETVFKHADFERKTTAVTARKGQNGVPDKVVMTSESTYDRVNKQWVSSDRKWIDHEKRWLQEETAALRSAYGTLIWVDTNYVDNIHRRYVPEYDDSGREIAGRGYKLYDGKDWRLEFDYSGYEWKQGELRRVKTEKFNGDRRITETVSSQGLPKEEIDLEIALMAGKDRIGTARRVITYTYEGQYPLIANKGQTHIVIEYNDGTRKNVLFTESELTGFNATRTVDGVSHGAITLKLTDKLRGITWFETKDISRRNRTLESYEEIPVNGAVYKRVTTHDYNGEIVPSTGLPFSFYDIAETSSVTVVRPDGRKEAHKTSKAVDYDPASGDLKVQVKNIKLNNIVWHEVINKHHQLGQL
jgi:hypothetical protein